MRTALLRISDEKHFIGCSSEDQAECKCYLAYANLALHIHFEGWDATGETGEFVEHRPISKGDAHEEVV